MDDETSGFDEQELLRNRPLKNEEEVISELIRPEYRSSRKYITDEQSGKTFSISTPFAELMSRDISTANFGQEDYRESKAWSDLSWFCQYLTEISEGKINVSNAQRFCAFRANQIANYSKGKDATHAKLSRTTRSENVGSIHRFDRRGDDEGRSGFRLWPIKK